MGVELILDQPKAVLEIIKRNSRGEISSDERERGLEKIFATQGYRWLKERELMMGSMGNPFTNSEFEEFVFSKELQDLFSLLEKAVQELQRLNIDKLVTKAKEYLPDECVINTCIVPLIKPLPNSFTYMIGGKVVIFVYVDPGANEYKNKNIIIHELHHVGMAAIYQNYMEQCRVFSDFRAEIICKWTQALGEGYAMLAAAGGLGNHPNAHDLDLKRQWDLRMQDFQSDFSRVNRFFLNILTGIYSEEYAMEKGFELFGIQGPWYTVGWQVASVIETVFGRPRLVECIANPLQQFIVYNRAVKTKNRDGHAKLPVWSEELVDFVSTYQR